MLLRAIRRGPRTPEEVLTLLHTLPQRSTLHIRPGLMTFPEAHLYPEEAILIITVYPISHYGWGGAPGLCD